MAVELRSPVLVAYLDWVQPSKHISWGGPMNGQRHRQQMIRKLVALIQPRAIVETGTYRGTTTEFLANVSGSPVYSVEISRRFHRFAEWRFKGRSEVHINRDDSRRFLRSLAASPEIPRDCVLFYLDAHWGSDLPVADELTTITSHWSRSVIVIDDFQVPGDTGYGFDDYGNQGRLTSADLPDLPGWAALFPSVPSSDETGARRGCIVLYPQGAFDEGAMLECGLKKARHR